MKKSAAPRRNPESELQRLRDRLQEAEDTLDAIRMGHVEALLVTTPDGPKVYTLEGADHRYRRLVETMNEGALLVSASGLIVYSNAAFAAMVHADLEKVVGGKLCDFVDPVRHPACTAMLAAARVAHVSDELTLRATTGLPVAAHFSMSPSDEATPGISVIVTNLTTQKRNEEMVASERLASSILDQAAEAIVVCDPNGIVIRASRAAREIASGEALRQHVFSCFPLRGAATDPHPASRALAGEVTTNVEMTLHVEGRDEMHVLCTSSPLVNIHREILGCVMSMTDVTGHRRAEAERAQLLAAERAARSSAERARIEAEASSRSKDEFLATVSHELRTPLNAIVGWARILSELSLPDERHRHAIEVIRRNADAQSRLIEDLLDVSRIISGQMNLDVHPVDAARVLRTVIDSVRPALDAKELRLETEVDAGGASVLGDEARLQQVVWNLLANAAKFTPRQGTIRVGLRRVASAVEISIADDGQGIPADFLPYVFDRFRQADGGIGRAHGGLGLGLAISRHLVELHGGRIEVASGGRGLGSTFTVRLPDAALRETPLPVSAPPESDQAPTAALLGGTDLRNVHVLVVEDDDDSRDMLMAILARCGARVSGTSSGHDALARLDAELPHVLVSDIGMPEMDGYTLIRRVRGLETGSKVPALALTAYARAEDRRRALAEGFQMHLSKPVDPSALVAAVASLAKSSESAPSSQ